MSSIRVEANNIGLIIAAVKKFGFAHVEARGKSMLPLLPDGTRVKIVKKRFGDIKPHDWVAFTKGGHLLVHEVLFKSKKYLVSWGVNNRRTDGVVAPNQVVGVVKKKQVWRQWHLIYLAEARSLWTDFRKAEVKNLMLKGPQWQIAKYGYLLDKPSSDIDWLINKNRYDVVKKILNRHGYYLEESRWTEKKYYQGAVPRVSEMTYVKKVFGAKLAIDLHLQAVREALTAWYKEPITSDNMSRLTRHLLEKQVREHGWPVLPDTECLFYLCLNLMIHHGSRGIYQLANIAHLADRGKVDWDKVVEIATNYRAENYLYFPLLWANRLFKVEVQTLSRLKPTPIRLWLAKLMINRFTIMRPIPSSKWLQSRMNLLVIGYLRIVLSAWKKSHRSAEP